MLETLNKCPLCNNETLDPLFVCKDNTATDEEFGIVKCNACTFTFTNPRPEENNVGKYYQSEKYISHSGTKKGVVNSLYHMVRNRTLQQKLDLINKLNNGNGKLLDIGCGTGHFLETCKKSGWGVKGIEPGMDYIQFPETIKGDIAGKNLLEANLQEKFDIITMWHVLEHIYPLHETLEEMKSLLNPGGHIIIAVPNSNSYDCMHYGKFWAAWDVPRHIWHFTPVTMQKLLNDHGLKLTKTLPMKFDSFYVSMLSEKYMHGKNRLPQAFATGLKSNLKAATDGNYSSLIYIAKI